MPVCKKCRVEKNNSGFYLNKENNKPYGTCIDCWQSRVRLLREVKLGLIPMPKTEEEKAIETGNKKCHKCEILKPLKEFRFDKKENRHLHECLNCLRIRAENNYKRKKEIKPPKKTAREKTLEKGSKICSKCETEKSLDNFSITDCRADGFHSLCKICELKAKENAALRTRIYIKNNPEKRKAYNLLRKEHDSKYMKEWRQKKREHRKLYRRKYNRERKLTDINFKILYILRGRLLQAIKGNAKAKSTMKLLGCTMDFFKEHIRAKFVDGMTWQNHGKGKGKWHIDHILPCASFDMSKKEDQIKCFHYTNLQPLWEHDNLSKSDKIISQTDQSPQLPGSVEFRPGSTPENAQLTSSQYTDPCF